MNDLIPYLELHKTMKEDGKETLLNNELEEKEKEFVGKEISVSGTVSEIDLNGNELIVSFLLSSPEDQILIENKMISHYFFIFAYTNELQNLVESLKIEIDDLVLINGTITSLHRNSIMRILLSSVSVTKKNQGPPKLKKKKGCFIATAVYEDPDSPEIRKFYGIRDHILARTFFGRIFISLYYFFSPPLAKWIVGKAGSKRLVRKYILDPILCFFYN